MSTFAELCAASNFSFLRGASHPEEMVEQAQALGLAGIGVADRNTLAGVVRAHVMAKELKQRLIIGARLSFRDGTPDIFAYPRDRAGYGRLTKLLTVGNRRAPKGECWLAFEDFLQYADGLQAIVVPPADFHVAPPRLPDAAQPRSGTHVIDGEKTGTWAPVLRADALRPGSVLSEALTQIRARVGAVWLAAPLRVDGEDKRRLRVLKALASETGARLVATTEPLHHVAARRALLDVVTCIREKTTLDKAGRLLAANAERHLKPAEEMARVYRDAPEAVDETLRFLRGITFSLDELQYQYPDECVTGFAEPQTALETLSWAGARAIYGDEIPERVRNNLTRELGIVRELNYAPYFLTVFDIVTFARGRVDHEGNPRDPILCQGRGSAANSTICFCLGITAVDPAKNELLFDRFISTERNEPPDIDVDFEHERREDVIQYVYKKYGRARAGLAATLICYRSRSSIRDVGKAFGFSEDKIAALAKTQQWWSKGVEHEDAKRIGLDLSDARLVACIQLARELRGFPRHLSQHVGGFVITRERLDEVVPIQNAAMDDRTVVEWDKEDLEALKILKVDLLGLGMLSCLKKAFDMIEARYPDWKSADIEECCAPSVSALRAEPSPPFYGGGKLDLMSIPKEDPRVYAMLQRADSVGVFQVESRAQMSMLPRLKPDHFYDLVIEVAIVRPGPIQGGMVHPYLKRRQGIEKVSYPKPELEKVLKRTLGVPLFQEQAMSIAIVAAGFTPPEADKLRRAMATFRRVGTIGQLRDKFINGMLANGYEREFAERSFSQIEGFGEYGFPESHAASFALLVYASSWVKCHYPDVFAAALLNAQPMGFYASAQIVRDAEEHGVEVRAADVNSSAWDNTIEPALRKPLHRRHREMEEDVRHTHALRLGLREINGLREEDLRQFVARRGAGYDSVRDVWLRGGLSPAAIEKLADADAFRSLGLDRREALWAARGFNRVGGQEDLPLFAQSRDLTGEPDFALPPMPLGEHVIEDYRTLKLSLKAHPAGLLREELRARGAIKAQELETTKDGARVRTAGLVLVRQRPGTASGVIFMTLEDETHIANIIVWPKVFERFRGEVLGARLCAVDGRVQSESGVIHIVAERILDFTSLLSKLSSARLMEVLARADEIRRPGSDARVNTKECADDLFMRAQEAMPKGRNFH